MNGKMIWFNHEKGHGFIRTETDERLYVAADGFSADASPEPRCAGKAVAFERLEGDDGPRAVDVRYITVPEARRARLRHSR